MSMHRSESTYTLDELTSDAEVTVRTVRYYIAEGLLPPPEGAGRAARYTQEHRDRLAVIATLKARHLPLREIRDILRDLSPEEIADLAGSSQVGHMIASSDQRPTESNITPDSHASNRPETDSAAPPGDARAFELVRSLQESAAQYRHEAPRRDPSDQQWRRLPITSEAELMVTEEVWQRRREQLESLLTWARRIISEP